MLPGFSSALGAVSKVREYCTVSLPRFRLGKVASVSGDGPEMATMQVSTL